MFIVPITPMTITSEIQQLSEVTKKQESSGELPFADIFSQALQQTRESQAIAQQSAYDLAMGNIEDLEGMMIEASKATTALELTVQLTTRAVSAYNEIMRMQI